MRIELYKGIILKDSDVSLSQLSLKLLFNRLTAQNVEEYILMNEKRNMIRGRREWLGCLSVKVDKFEFKRVDHFKYLGTIISK